MAPGTTTKTSRRLAPLLAVGFGLLVGAAAAIPPTAVDPVRAALDSLWSSGRRDDFRAVLATELVRATAHGDTIAVVRLLALSGARDVSVGRAVAAEDSLRRGVALAAAARADDEALPALRWLAVAQGTQGRFDEATATCRRLLALARARGDRRHQGWAQVGLAWNALQRGEVDTAQVAYQTAEADLRAADDTEGEIWARNGLAMTMSRRGDLAGALATYRALAVRAAELDLQLAEALAVNNAGHCLYLLGDPGEARACFTRARRMQDDLGHAREALIPTLNLALCLQDLGQVDAAADTLRRCLERSLALGYADIAGEACLEQASLERRAGRPHAAAATARRALALGDRLAAQDRGRAGAILAEALADQDSAAAALAALDGVAAQVPAASLGPVAADLDLARARALALAGAPDAALAILARTLAAFSDDDRAQTRARLQQGRLLAAQGPTAAARDALGRGLAVWERQRSLPVQPEWRETRASLGQALATELAALILATGANDAHAEAYRVLQSFKARTLLERRLGPGTAMPADDAVVPLDVLRTQILRDGECLLDLTLGEHGGILYAIARDTVAVFRLDLDDDVGTRVEALAALLVPRTLGATPDDQRDAVLRAATARLRWDLVGPAAAITTGRRHVILAADGAAHTVPLEPWDDGVTRWSRTPSAGMLARIRTDDLPPALSSASPLLVLANHHLPDGRELSGVQREWRRIRQRFRGVAVRAEGDLRARYATAAVVHVAAHAEVVDQAPWRSSLALSLDGAAGNWSADAIAATPTTAGLVVLSSCSTARGRVVSGEGLVGLASAFLAGGAHTVVATLWPIDDDAAAWFMARCYDHLAAGHDVATAVALAREAMRAESAFADPSFWSGFVVIGDGALRMVIAETPHRFGLHAAAATAAVLAAAALSGTWWWRRRWRRRGGL